MVIALSFVFAVSAAAALAGRDANGSAVPPPAPSVRIGNFLTSAPGGIAFVVEDAAAFVVDTGAPYVAGTAAPDDSYHRFQFHVGDANITFEWGRVGDGAVARLTSDKAVELPLRLAPSWPGFTTHYTTTPEGATGEASLPGGRKATWAIHTSPVPLRTTENQVVVALSPQTPLYFAAGMGALPPLAGVDQTLAAARQSYETRRPAAAGDWGNFIGTIADNCNNSRIYSSDNHRLAHSVSRGWAHDPNSDPYFCWDSFFTADLACLDDPLTARDTVRAILSYQTPEGLVPNFAHWPGSSDDRSQPPVGALCVWKMQQRWPDLAFLREVYPRLLRWHQWWPTARDGNHNGLLEWGSATKEFQGALWETGWDDTLQFEGARMAGTTMNADAVDLNALFAMDAEYLARIADAIGRPADARWLRTERQTMIRRMDDRLWNDKLGCYCSRLWDGAESIMPVDLSAFGAGFDAVFFDDEDLKHEVARRHDDKLNFDWNGAAPAAGVPGVHWSARWTGVFTPPSTGTYRFSTTSDDGVRLFVDGQKVIDDWKVQASTEETADVPLTARKPVPVTLEYFQHEFGSSLHFSVSTVQRTSGVGLFLTRLTPMNFYPLIAGIPDRQRADRMISILTDPHKFWGTWTVPTLAYDDPAWVQQNYWRGKVWGPVNYLVFQGLQRYATPEQQMEFAGKSVSLFMRNWTNKGVCGENYLSTTGEQSSDPHYT
ncbi:MAG: PA14 domain-containing protein, partial [Armatimonadota bacterium]|nr:PA14 domain-containing protein [Armatimonadota bacterium]